VIIAGTAVIIFLGGCIVFFVVIYKRRQAKYKQEKKNMETNFREELLNTQLEIREQTMKNISQEIHDNIGQTLSLVKLNLNTINLEKEDVAKDKIHSSKELVSKAIHDLRNLSRTLNTDFILSGGFLKAIETELSIVNHADTFQTALNIAGKTVEMDPKKELILFRIVQEAINNIIKHSNATAIMIDAVFDDSRFAITISDNGKGFDTSSSLTDGSGLRNMSSRAALIGGIFDIQSGPGGTKISVNLPITES
jgi:signal transduction histidine kinase